MERQRECKCRVCGKKYQLPEALVEENFFTVETDYCEKCIKNVKIISLLDFKYHYKITGNVVNIGLYGDTIGVENYNHISIQERKC